MGCGVFAKYRPDYCILETGLGGRLDATNSVSKKELEQPVRAMRSANPKENILRFFIFNKI